MNLREKAFAGLIWGGGFRVLQNLLNLCLTLILVRILDPKDYGQFAVLMGILGFVNSITYENFVSHIIQVRDESKIPYQDHFTAAVCIQCLVFLLLNITAWILSSVPAYENFAYYLYYMSASVIFIGVGGFRYIILEKQLNWKRYRILQAIGLICSMSIALTFALNGGGILALLFSPFGKFIPAIIDLFFVQRWKPTWEFSWKAYYPSFQFGLKRLASKGLKNGAKTFETNLLFIFLGVIYVGYLNRSFGITQLIILQFTTIVGQSLFPILTRFEPGSDSCRTASTIVYRSIAWTTIPVAVMLGSLAEPFINTVFGPKWLPSAGLLPYTLACVTINSLGYGAYTILLANNHEGRCLRYDVIRIIGVGIALALWPLYKNIMVYLLLLSICEMTTLVILLKWLKDVNILTLKDFQTIFLPPLITSAFGFAIIILPGQSSTGNTLFDWATFQKILLYCISCILSFRCLFSRTLFESLNYLPYPERLKTLLFYKKIYRFDSQ